MSGLPSMPLHTALGQLIDAAEGASRVPFRSLVLALGDRAYGPPLILAGLGLDLTPAHFNAVAVMVFGLAIAALAGYRLVGHDTPPLPRSLADLPVPVRVIGWLRGTLRDPSAGRPPTGPRLSLAASAVVVAAGVAMIPLAVFDPLPSTALAFVAVLGGVVLMLRERLAFQLFFVFAGTLTAIAAVMLVL